MKKTTIALTVVAVTAVIAAGAFFLTRNHHDDHTGQMPQGISQNFGDLTLMNAFAFATLPNQPVGGAFVSVQNTGASDDRLIGATSPLAGHMEIHTMAVNGGVMQMRELPDGLPIPAGERIVMKPGGYHLMLMGLTAPLVAMQSVPVTLTFEQSGTVTIKLPIHARTRGGQNHNAHSGQ